MRLETHNLAQFETFEPFEPPEPFEPAEPTSDAASHEAQAGPSAHSPAAAENAPDVPSPWLSEMARQATAFSPPPAPAPPSPEPAAAAPGPEAVAAPDAPAAHDTRPNPPPASLPPAPPPAPEAPPEDDGDRSADFAFQAGSDARTERLLAPDAAAQERAQLALAGREARREQAQQRLDNLTLSISHWGPSEGNLRYADEAEFDATLSELQQLDAQAADDPGLGIPPPGEGAFPDASVAPDLPAAPSTSAEQPPEGTPEASAVLTFAVPGPAPAEVTPLPVAQRPAPLADAPAKPADPGATSATGTEVAPPAAPPIEFMKQPDGQPVLLTGAGPAVSGLLREAPDLAFPYPGMLDRDTHAQAFIDEAGQVFWTLEGPQVPGGSATVVVAAPLPAAGPRTTPDSAPGSSPDSAATPAATLALALSDVERLTQINAWLLAQGRVAVAGLAEAAGAVADVLQTGARLAGAALEAAEVASLAGLAAVAGAINLVLIPLSRNGITPLGDDQRLVSRPGELYGQLQARDDDGHWQTVKTGVRLVLNGSERQALSDEEIAQLARPLINVPAPQDPSGGMLGTPALDPNDTRTQTPGYGSTDPLPAPPSLDQPMHEADWRDSILTKDGNADNNADRAAASRARNPGLADPSQLEGQSAVPGRPSDVVGQWAYPPTPRGARDPNVPSAGQAFQEAGTGVPAGLEINLGGTPRTTPNGTPTAEGGVWLDGVRMEATGQLVYIDRKEWNAWPPLNVPELAAESVQKEAERQLRYLPSGAMLEWQMSDAGRADAVRELLDKDHRGRLVIKVVGKP